MRMPRCRARPTCGEACEDVRLHKRVQGDASGGYQPGSLLLEQIAQSQYISNSVGCEYSFSTVRTLIYELCVRGTGPFHAHWFGAGTMNGNQT